jgi:restriction system protein
MPQVDLDDDVFEAIKAQAEPLVDDVNSVLRRVFGVRGARARSAVPAGAGRAAPGSILSEREYELPILQELLARGGSGQATEITDAVGERLKDKLTERDRENLNSGDIRWRNRAQFTRLTLRKRGLLREDSPRGIWELTAEGRKVAEAG